LANAGRKSIVRQLTVTEFSPLARPVVMPIGWRQELCLRAELPQARPELPARFQALPARFRALLA
jgi:hypothetical protein